MSGEFGAEEDDKCRHCPGRRREVHPKNVCRWQRVARAGGDAFPQETLSASSILALEFEPGAKERLKLLRMPLGHLSWETLVILAGYNIWNSPGDILT